MYCYYCYYSFVWVNEGFTKLPNRKLGLLQFFNIADSNKRLSLQKNARMVKYKLIFSVNFLKCVKNYKDYE